jgi:hypothetical protein
MSGADLSLVLVRTSLADGGGSTRWGRRKHVWQCTLRASQKQGCARSFKYSGAPIRLRRTWGAQECPRKSCIMPAVLEETYVET